MCPDCTEKLCKTGETRGITLQAFLKKLKDRDELATTSRFREVSKPVTRTIHVYKRKRLSSAPIRASANVRVERANRAGGWRYQPSLELIRMWHDEGHPEMSCNFCK